jgi:predicted N-formylglutamate amidohydrolase
MTESITMPAHADEWPAPIEVLNEQGDSPLVLICEHASNHIPSEYNGLGLRPSDLMRHIAWDIGAANVTRGLAKRLNATAFLANYSRLLVDLNRPLHASSCMPARSEDTEIPGNMAIDHAERERRIRKMFTPFHDCIAEHLDKRQRAGTVRSLVTIHSFTPIYLGQKRPWHVGVLFDKAQDLGHAIMDRLKSDLTLNVGANVPYDVSPDDDYAVPIHGDNRNIPAVLIEIRNDLITDPADADRWAARLATILA